MITTTFYRNRIFSVFLFSFLVFANTACNSVKSSSAGDYTEIIFGTGGGVTGAVDEYHLYPDGTIKKNGAVVKKLSKMKMHKATLAFSKVDFNHVGLDDPSNIYYFLGYKSVLKDQKLTWNEETHIPDPVQKAYNKLMKLVK
jgi:hypothetical protein